MPVCLPDTSCLNHLERIDRLDLLHALYDDLRIPPAVRDEYGDVPDGIGLADAPTRSMVRLLRRTVNAGEAEVIVLGTDLDDAHVVRDDAAARACTSPPRPTTNVPSKSARRAGIVRSACSERQRRAGEGAFRIGVPAYRTEGYPPITPSFEKTICHSCIFRTRKEAALDSRK